MEISVIGIDLGTTNSAVAVPDVRPSDGFLVPDECPTCSIIVDRLKRRTTPSVVAEDEKGEIVVGYKAKARAGLSPEPIMFSKRDMGEDKTFPLRQRGGMRPEEAAAEVLKELKGLAKLRLGHEVEQAVITVPAYFRIRAKQMTERAAELAGLTVSELALEPVAAALTYCAKDPRDPLRIMTYDLGGGTFDVAILEKRDGAITNDSVLAFDGDCFLGGYNFDKTLAHWITDQLNARGYDLKLDDKRPEDRVIFAKLMVIAEKTKIALSKDPTCQIEETTTGINDHSGNPVVIELEITREQFEDMIRKEVEWTLEVCHRAMEEKADRPIRPEQIDEIVMVGGSSKIPLVARRLAEEFGKTPRLVEPDLCVALGAAIIAKGKGATYRNFALDPIPSQTDLTSLTVTGKLVPGDKLKDVDGCTVTLRAADGSYERSRTTKADAKFAFDAVPLAVEDTTDFVLTVTAPDGTKAATHPFSVEQTAAPKGGLMVDAGVSIPKVLSKPIRLQLADGPHEIAPARTPLPFETVTRARTVDTSGRILIPLLEENSKVGRIEMQGVPETLPVGSAIEITVTITESFQIHGKAHVPALGRDERVTINIPAPDIRTFDELREEYEVLAAEAEDALSTAGRGAVFQDANAKRLRDRLTQCDEMMRKRSPDRPRIQNTLDEIRSMVERVSAGWSPEPPRAVFEEACRDCTDAMQELYQKKPQAKEDGYEEQLQAIRDEADEAYRKQNTAAWKQSYGRVIKLSDQLRGMTGGDGGGGTPEEYLMALAQQLERLREKAERAGRLRELQADFNDAVASLEAIDPKAPDAMAKIRDWYFAKLQPLQKKLGAPVGTGIPELDK